MALAVAEEPADNHKEEDNTSGSSSKDSSPKKDSMFKVGPISCTELIFCCCFCLTICIKIYFMLEKFGF